MNIKNKIPLGMPLSAIISEVYTQNFESTIIYGMMHIRNIFLWVRYGVVILAIFNHNIISEHQIILNELNFNKKLIFTVETDHNRITNFLIQS